MTTSDTVESLGSGIPRILRAYGEYCFKFTDNFIRIILPISNHDHASVQVEKLVSALYLTSLASPKVGCGVNIKIAGGYKATGDAG
ncbi:MAG: hypothetical protein E7088_07345 [Bacteroidales bacterium]|nr:hypothetical protein [Bacteroidales bacterium]